MGPTGQVWLSTARLTSWCHADAIKPFLFKNNSTISSELWKFIEIWIWLQIWQIIYVNGSEKSKESNGDIFMHEKQSYETASGQIN